MSEIELILVGFAGAFRRSELVEITMDDLEFNRDGLTIMLKHGKTDPEGQGYKKGIPYGSQPDTCPVRSLQDWLQASNIIIGPLSWHKSAWTSWNNSAE